VGVNLSPLTGVLEVNVKANFRYRLYPNESQRRALGYHFGCCRFGWNSCLASRQRWYEKTGKSVTFHQMSNRLRP
jgi:putative transposase